MYLLVVTLSHRALPPLKYLLHMKGQTMVAQTPGSHTYPFQLPRHEAFLSQAFSRNSCKLPHVTRTAWVDLRQ